MGNDISAIDFTATSYTNDRWIQFNEINSFYYQVIFIIKSTKIIFKLIRIWNDTMNNLIMFISQKSIK